MVQYFYYTNIKVFVKKIILVNIHLGKVYLYIKTLNFLKLFLY